MKIGLTFTFLIFLASCASSGRVSIDQIPMYGGMDRSTILELAAADQVLIDRTAKEFGSRNAASSAFVDRAFRLYGANDLEGAMRRFNQAWLINKENPEVYHGFGSILYDQGDNCGAMEVMNNSLDLDWGDRKHNRHGFLADLAMITSLCAYTTGFEKWGSQKSLIEKSDQLFLEAENLASNAYLYDKWWQALYWRADFSGAWQKIFKMRDEGGNPNPEYLKMLNKKMSEPHNE